MPFLLFLKICYNKNKNIKSKNFDFERKIKMQMKKIEGITTICNYMDNVNFRMLERIEKDLASRTLELMERKKLKPNDYKIEIKAENNGKVDFSIIENSKKIIECENANSTTIERIEALFGQREREITENKNIFELFQETVAKNFDALKNYNSTIPFSNSNNETIGIIKGGKIPTLVLDKEKINTIKELQNNESDNSIAAKLVEFSEKQILTENPVLNFDITSNEIQSETVRNDEGFGIIKINNQMFENEASGKNIVLDLYNAGKKYNNRRIMKDLISVEAKGAEFTSHSGILFFKTNAKSKIPEISESLKQMSKIQERENNKQMCYRDKEFNISVDENKNIEYCVSALKDCKFEIKKNQLVKGIIPPEYHALITSRLQKMHGKEFENLALNPRKLSDYESQGYISERKGMIKIEDFPKENYEKQLMIHTALQNAKTNGSVIGTSARSPLFNELANFTKTLNHGEEVSIYSGGGTTKVSRNKIEINNATVDEKGVPNLISEYAKMQNINFDNTVVNFEDGSKLRNSKDGVVFEANGNIENYEKLYSQLKTISQKSDMPVIIASEGNYCRLNVHDSSFDTMAMSENQKIFEKIATLAEKDNFKVPEFLKPKKETKIENKPRKTGRAR